MEPIMVMLSTLSSARVENKLLEFFVNAWWGFIFKNYFVSFVVHVMM
jgi:hypothetical protein